MSSEASQTGYCVFCNIIRGTEPSYKIFESDHVVGFLDIQPTRRGHVILAPKAHVKLLSDLPLKDAAALGEAMVKVSKAITLAFDKEALTVSLNQVYAQTVPHTHFHIVPAPDPDNTGTSTPKLVKRSGLIGRYHTRTQLDDEDAEEVLKMIKSRL